VRTTALRVRAPSRRDRQRNRLEAAIHQTKRRRSARVARVRLDDEIQKLRPRLRPIPIARARRPMRMRMIDADHLEPRLAQLSLQAKLQRRVDEVRTAPIGSEVSGLEGRRDPIGKPARLARPDEHAAGLLGMLADAVLQDAVGGDAVEDHHDGPAASREEERASRTRRGERSRSA
jgi:hypothetical protein